MTLGDFPLRRSSCLNHEIKRLNRLRVSGSILGGPLLLCVVLVSGEAIVPIRHLRILGTTCLALGIGLRLWALGCIGGNKKCRLVTWGPYRHLRHPLYCGSFLFGLGFCLEAGSVTAAGLFCLLFIGLFAPAMRAEERLLAVQYGPAWETYRRHTWALFPRPTSLLDRPEVPFRLQRPVRELAVLLTLAILAFGAAALARRLQQAYPLPDWFF